MLRIKQLLYIVLAIAGAVTAVMAASGSGSSAYAQPDHRGFLDSRHYHNRYYPPRGGYVTALPHGYRAFVHGGNRFYFHGGIWYRTSGPRFVVVPPPIGIVIPFLPPFYTTVWFGGVPYYYANEVYYVQAPGGYMVTAPPSGENPQTSTGAASAVDRIFIYPRQGQNQQQQANDQYECHRWAVGQTGYDPTQPSEAGMDPLKRSDYQRAMNACLDGRGYTVK